MSSKNIGEYDDLLDPSLFFRSHKSWLVNLQYVQKFSRQESQVLLTNGILADVSARKKDDFLKLFEKI